jgi:hypothetical protein
MAGLLEYIKSLTLQKMPAESMVLLHNIVIFRICVIIRKSFSQMKFFENYQSKDATIKK